MPVISSIGRSGDSQTMLKIAGALLVLLLATVVSAAGSAALPRRGLFDSTDKPITIALDLMHVQHVDSPYRQPNLTLTERMRISLANNKRRLQTQSNFNSSVEYSQNDYIVQITIGTPPRTLLPILDTGSDLVWLQCSTCTTCFQDPRDPPFNATASSSYIDMNCTAAPCTELGGDMIPCPSTNICGYNYSYGDSSFTDGNMAYETLTFNSSNGSTTLIPDVAFGCGIDDGGNFGRSDGLVGFGRGPLSLVSQLGSTINYIFSYCLVDSHASLTQTSTLLLGSAGFSDKANTPLIYNTDFPSFYYVNLTGISVNGTQVDYPNGTFDIDSSTGIGGIILDSGTTVSMLFDEAYNPFQNAISALISYPEVSGELALCYDTSSVSNPVFPTVVFQFENVDVTLTPNNTFAFTGNDTYCLAFSNAGSVAVAQQSIFGNIQQSNHEIAFDVHNNNVGFNIQPISCLAG